MAREFKANWSGTFPCRCKGEWTLFADGEDITRFIPEEMRYGPMYTYGVYDSWHFENRMEVFDYYAAGLECDEWIKDNEEWLSKFATREEMPLVFEAFQAEDWRPYSCGGCI